MLLNRMIAEAFLDPKVYITASQNGHSFTVACVYNEPIEMKWLFVWTIQIYRKITRRQNVSQPSIFITVHTRRECASDLE